MHWRLRIRYDDPHGRDNNRSMTCSCYSDWVYLGSSIATCRFLLVSMCLATSLSFIASLSSFSFYYATHRNHYTCVMFPMPLGRLIRTEKLRPGLNLSRSWKPIRRRMKIVQINKSTYFT